MTAIGVCELDGVRVCLSHVQDAGESGIDRARLLAYTDALRRRDQPPECPRQQIEAYVRVAAADQFDNRLLNTLLQRGQLFIPAPRPSDVPKMPSHTAIESVRRLIAYMPNLRCAVGVRSSGESPFKHTWCIDPEGRVIDPTCRRPEDNSYYGVVVNPLDIAGYLIDDGISPFDFDRCSIGKGQGLR